MQFFTDGGMLSPTLYGEMDGEGPLQTIVLNDSMLCSGAQILKSLAVSHGPSPSLVRINL